MRAIGKGNMGSHAKTGTTTGNELAHDEIRQKEKGVLLQKGESHTY